MRDSEDRTATQPPAPVAVLVADDPTDRALVRLVLDDDGWRSVETPLDHATALRALRQERGAAGLILVLDTADPDRARGLALLDTARRAGVDRPVVVLSRRADAALRRCLAALGVRDIVDLPVLPRLLQQRLRVALGDAGRRRARGGMDEALRAGGLILRATSGEVSDRAGWTTRVTPREAAILAALMRTPGQPVRRDDLLDDVWGQEYAGAGNVLEVYIRRLREKLSGAAVPPRVIATVRTHGYVFDARQVPRGPLPPPLPQGVLVIGERHDADGEVGPVLAAAGYQVVHDPTGEHLDRIRWQRPALILLDTPTFNDGGRDLRTRLRALPGAALVPIIALLERGHAHLWPVGLDIDDYLLRPVDPDELLWRVAAYARPDATRGAPQGTEEACPTTTGAHARASGPPMTL